MDRILVMVNSNSCQKTMPSQDLKTFFHMMSFIIVTIALSACSSIHKPVRQQNGAAMMKRNLNYFFNRTHQSLLFNKKFQPSNLQLSCKGKSCSTTEIL